ncbi:MAG TPA: discoidin domain-containing protein [Streptosporangiaceae bacterium]|nr:discoidin domain-containing protein [Streptosporangiaceae bacterium]
MASNATNPTLTVALSGTGASSTTNLALNQPVTASSYYQTYVPSNAVDGNTSTYWESSDGAGYPQTITVDLGSVQPIGSITLDLPPSSAWNTRTETLSVLGSTNGSTFTQIVASAGYTFNPATGNTVTISLPSGTSARYVRLSFTGNTGWNAAQLSEFEVFPGGGGSGSGSALTASPSSLSFGNTAVGSTSSAQTVTVSNPNNTAVSVSQLAVSGPFGQTNTCGASIPANGSCTVSVTFAPTAAGAASGTLSVASSAPGSPLTVALSGTGTTSNTNLALNRPVTASGYTQTYVPANAVDGNTSTYWESTDNAFPQWFQVDLGSATSISRIVMDLPPSSAWGTRTQTITIQGSTDGTAYTTLVPSQGYTFNPSTGNTASITFSAATVRYVKLTFTANTGWPAGQLSELQIYTS